MNSNKSKFNLISDIKTRTMDEDTEMGDYNTLHSLANIKASLQRVDKEQLSWRDEPGKSSQNKST